MRIFQTFCFLLTLVACTSELDKKNILEYQPLKFDGDSLVLDENQISEEHYDQVEFVLSHYKIEYKRSDLLKINLEHAISKEMAFNYTNKAKDIKWLKDRGFKKT